MGAFLSKRGGVCRTKEEILAFREKHLLGNQSVSYGKNKDTCLKIVKGRGQYLFNEDGVRFLGTL